jgi:3-deoxy-7-phosphoheptulonate synthase
MVLVDFHPFPSKALVDGPQALHMDELGYFLEDIATARQAYEQRLLLAQQHRDRLAAAAAAELT